MLDVPVACGGPPILCNPVGLGHYSVATSFCGNCVATKIVAKLLALAIRFDQLIRDGTVADQAELARLGYVPPSRISQ